MSSATKCDRCGVLAEIAIGDVSFASYKVVTAIRDGDAVSQDYTEDLCPKCSEKFLNWMNHKP